MYQNEEEEEECPQLIPTSQPESAANREHTLPLGVLDGIPYLPCCTVSTRYDHFVVLCVHVEFYLQKRAWFLKQCFGYAYPYFISPP